MTHVIAAHFDGRVFIPDEPVELPTGRRLRLRIELAEDAEPRFAALLDFAADLPGAPSDLAVQHDHYLTGAPKR
jgi:predicted DNA-binding antitoxin AbrB/MazE fold protein